MDTYQLVISSAASPECEVEPNEIALFVGPERWPQERADLCGSSEWKGSIRISFCVPGPMRGLDLYFLSQFVFMISCQSASIIPI